MAEADKGQGAEGAAQADPGWLANVAEADLCQMRHRTERGGMERRARPQVPQTSLQQPGRRRLEGEHNELGFYTQKKQYIINQERFNAI